MPSPYLSWPPEPFSDLSYPMDWHSERTINNRTLSALIERPEVHNRSKVLCFDTFPPTSTRLPLSDNE
ncbi:hypothetical protein J6590_026328 [Homalodisca vitripennis]|nr:hypothetical protein J6590_026328 [Homalodisca vitripennis]